MGSLKTILLAANIAFALPSMLSAASNDLALQFATCTGRLSAQMEFQWLIGADSEATKAERDAMISLLEAVVSPDDTRLALHRRIEAKYAQNRLLTRAYFNDDPADAAWAADRAEVELGTCRSLILS